MALGGRANYAAIPATALATLASLRNPDGSVFSMGTTPTAEAAVTDIGFSVTAVAGGTVLPNQACHLVRVQNRMTADDGTTTQDNAVWVIVGGVKVFELVPGQSVDVYVTNANLVTIMSFTATNLVSGAIKP